MVSELQEQNDFTTKQTFEDKSRINNEIKERKRKLSEENERKSNIEFKQLIDRIEECTERLQQNHSHIKSSELKEKLISISHKFNTIIENMK